MLLSFFLHFASLLFLYTGVLESDPGEGSFSALKSPAPGAAVGISMDTDMYNDDGEEASVPANRWDSTPQPSVAVPMGEAEAEASEHALPEASAVAEQEPAAGLDAESD